MSMSKLLYAVQDHLRAKLELDRKYVGIENSMQPPPFMGGFYYSIYPKAIEPYAGVGEVMNGIGQSYTIGVAISMKAGRVPKDRDVDELYAKQYSGLEARAFQVIAHLHQNWEAMGLANTLIGPTGGNFIEWLRWGGTSIPQEVGPDHFWEDPDPTGPITTGFVVDITFSGASRFIPLANLTAGI